MKRLLLACCLFGFSAAPVLAQNSAETTTKQQSNPKANFSSKINEFSAHMSRGNTAGAHEALKELGKIMSWSMHLTVAKADRATGGDKVALEKAKKSQQSLFDQVKTLTQDLTKNQGAIVEKLRAFQQTM